MESQGQRRPRRPAGPRRHGDRRQRRPRHRRASPIEDGEQVARYLADIAGRTPGLTILERTVNGQPGLVVQQDGVTVAVYAVDVAGDRIKHI